MATVSSSSSSSEEEEEEETDDAYRPRSRDARCIATFAGRASEGTSPRGRESHGVSSDAQYARAAKDAMPAWSSFVVLAFGRPGTDRGLLVPLEGGATEMVRLARCIPIDDDGALYGSINPSTTTDNNNMHDDDSTTRARAIIIIVDIIV